jgi:ArsR family transcriptional regulator
MTTSLPTAPGPAAATCGAPAAGLDPTLDAERIAASAKALSEPIRVKIANVLRRSPQPVCQCELIALFDIWLSLLSHHVRKLVEAGLVDVTCRHNWVYYAIAPDAGKELSTWLD